jgi:DHA1 family bicyclomycin/chloramphenicol resistance-like MFS transporter
MTHYRLIVILGALSMLGALSIDAYLPALPAIAAHFLVSLPAAQQTLSLYLFAFAFMTLFYGTLSDSFGRRPVIIVAMLVYSLSSLGAGLSTSFHGLLLFRFVQGLSAGAGSVVGRAIVGDLLTGAEAQRMMSYIMVVFGLAPAVAPILGGWLQVTLGWRSIFGCIALFSCILLATCLRYLPESLLQEQRHAFHFKAIVANYWHVARHGEFMLRCLSCGLTFSGTMLYVASAPAYVINILHLPVTSFAWLFLPLIGGMTLGSVVAGKVSHHWKSESTIVAGFAIMAVSALWSLFYNGTFIVRIPWAVLPLGAYAFGMALSNPAMVVDTLALFPKVRGLAASLQTFIFMIIFALGSGLVCPLLFGSALKLAVGTAVGLVLSLFCWYGAHSVTPLQAQEALGFSDGAE